MRLSRNTVVQSVIDLAADHTTQLKEKARIFLSYSLVNDESTDVTDTSQLSLYIRGVNPYFSITEALLCMPSLHDTTKSFDLFSAIKAYMNRYNLPWETLCGLTTHGAPSMTGKNNGLVGLLEAKLNDCTNHKLISIHP